MKNRTFAADYRKRVPRSKKQRRRFYDKNGHRCWYCGEGVKKKAFRLEHQQPFSRGGSCKLAENIVLSCESCDTEKGRKTVEEYRKALEKRYNVSVAFYGEIGIVWKRKLKI